MSPFKSANGNISNNNKQKKDNVKDTNSGEVHGAFNPSTIMNSSKHKNEQSNKSKVKIDKNKIFDQVFGNVRLSVRAVARLHAYQTLNKLANRSDALNQIFNKFLPKVFDANQMKHAKNIESLFEEKYKNNSKQYKRALKRLRIQAMKKSFKKRLNQSK